MSFTTLFTKSRDDYTHNFHAIFKFVFFFNLLPLLIFSAIQFIWAFLNKDLLTYLTNPLLYAASAESFLPSIPFFIFNILFGIASFFLLFFMYAGLTSAPLKKSRFDLNDLISGGRAFFFKYLGISLVYLLFLFLLFLLLIIPGIIFLVYWILGAYVCSYEKKGILQSLKRSKELVRGRWWKIFGYFIINLFFMSLIYLFAFFITLPAITYTTFLNLQGIPSTTTFFMITSLLNLLVNFLLELLILPFFILFFKNLYLTLAKTK